MYVCYDLSRHLIHSITEVSTCNYELILLTNLLCSHPAFQAPVIPEHEIHCYAPPNSVYAKPVQIRDLEKQVFAETFNQYSESKDSSTAPSRSAAFDRLVAQENTVQQLREKIAMKLGNSKPVHNPPQSRKTPVSEKKDPVEKPHWEKQLETEAKQEELERLIKLYKRAVDENESLYKVIKDFELDMTPEERNVAADFFSTKSCFIGGHGYWKYEFCYKKKVTYSLISYSVNLTLLGYSISCGEWQEDY